MKSITKKIARRLKKFINDCGYDIQKIPESILEESNAHKMDGVLYSHENIVDIYQYAYKSNEQSSSFKK